MPLSAPLHTFLHRIDLGTLNLFVLARDGGSIAAAAATANLAASAASKRIALLEQAAGLPLFERHARGVRPTPAGEQVYRHALAILFDAERLRGELAEFARGVRGRVLLCAGASAVEQFLPADIAAFVGENPEIRIEMRQATSRAVIEAVRNREVELGICNPTDGSAGLEARPYRRERLVLVTPRGHPLAGLDSTEFSRALDFEQIALRGSSTVQETLNRAARRARRVLRQGIEVDGLSAMCRMIECGLGIGVMPEGAFRALGAGGRLAAVRLTDSWAERQLNLYAVAFDDLPGPAQRFAARLAGSDCPPPSG